MSLIATSIGRRAAESRARICSDCLRSESNSEAWAESSSEGLADLVMGRKYHGLRCRHETCNCRALRARRRLPIQFAANLDEPLPSMALLEIEDVTRRFGDFTAVDRVTLAIEAGEFFTLLGPSGCGKTTLLRMIAGFDLPDGGRILLDGQDLADQPPEARPVRTVFQSYALFPHMTVQGNVAFPLRMAKTPAAEAPKKIAEAL